MRATLFIRFRKNIESIELDGEPFLFCNQHHTSGTYSSFFPSKNRSQGRLEKCNKTPSHSSKREKGIAEYKTMYRMLVVWVFEPLEYCTWVHRFEYASHIYGADKTMYVYRGYVENFYLSTYLPHHFLSFLSLFLPHLVCFHFAWPCKSWNLYLFFPFLFSSFVFAHAMHLIQKKILLCHSNGLSTSLTCSIGETQLKNSLF